MPDVEARSEVADALAAAVREGGALALQKFRATFKSWTKAGDSPVSEVDLAVDELLRERLMRALPSSGWLSEESVDDPRRLDRSDVWIVDPIDGTRAFIAGREDWVISAALVRAGRPVLGAIYVPAEDALIFAAEGKGATLNGQPLAVAASESFAGAVVSGPKRYVEAIQKRHAVEVAPRVHSLALRLARVATRALDIAFAGGNSRDWDIAAADLIVHEAGGVLTDTAGVTPLYNRPDPVHAGLMATGKARHREVVRLVQLETAPT